MVFRDAGIVYLSSDHPDRIVVWLTRPGLGESLLPKTDIAAMAMHRDWSRHRGEEPPTRTDMIRSVAGDETIPVRVSNTGKSLVFHIDGLLHSIPLHSIRQLLRGTVTVVNVLELIEDADQLHDARSNQARLEVY